MNIFKYPIAPTSAIVIAKKFRSQYARSLCEVDSVSCRYGDFFSSAVFGSLINQERCDVMSIHHSNISHAPLSSGLQFGKFLITSTLYSTSLIPFFLFLPDFLFIPPVTRLSELHSLQS